ncbi:MAG: hypothetical protein Q4C53_09220 [Clostridia bacterium]|nr:hypothetical protein [Clostridia bacterium]
MKRVLSLIMAVMFALSMITVSTAENAPFRGIVTRSVLEDFTVTAENGTTLSFNTGDGSIAPTVGTVVEVHYDGNPGEALVVKGIDTVQDADVRTETGIITDITGNTFIVATDTGLMLTFVTGTGEEISGKAAELAKGQKVKVIYSEVNAIVTVNLVIGVEVLETATQKVVKEAEKEEIPVNKTLTGTVTALSSSKITIKTSKGKKWTFKRTKKSKVRGKYSLDVGAKVTITYDGYASQHPLAKRIKVRSAAPAPGPTMKKISGVVEYFGGMAIGLKGKNFSADVAYAKHTGKGYHGEGTEVTITYYTENGRNYATKINWKG